MDLHSNLLSGRIPPELNFSMSYFSFGDNFLYGIIPSQLSLSNCELTSNCYNDSCGNVCNCQSTTKTCGCYPLVSAGYQCDDSNICTNDTCTPEGCLYQSSGECLSSQSSPVDECHTVYSQSRQESSVHSSYSSSLSSVERRSLHSQSNQESSVHSVQSSSPQAFHSRGNGGNTTVIVAIVVSVAAVVILGCASLLVMLILVLARPRNHGGDKFEEGSIKLSRLVYADPSIDLTSCKQVSEGSFPLQVSPSKLAFNLGTHQADIDTPITDEIKLSNLRKKPISFRLLAPKYPKYKIEFNPQSATVKPGSCLIVEVSLVIHCSTTVDTDVLVLAQSESIPGISEVFLPLKISLESKLSTSLDFDELVLNEPPIGEGSYGIVYSGKWRGQSVAVKLIKNQDGKNASTEFFNELKILETIRCPQIVNFIGAVKLPGKMAIVTEFFPLGNLTSCMKKHTFSLKLKTKCLLDCSRGMNFLHQSSLLHRDLKGDNLLMSSLDPSVEINCKISDFGTTRDINRAQDTQLYTQGVGTPAYMAPELLSQGKYKEPADVYSFAILSYLVLTEKVPYEGFLSLWKITDFVLEGNRLPIPETVPSQFKELITHCWAPDPTNRPCFARITAQLENLFTIY
eukprot:TRINITY_DN1121_c0_g1_i1.p1 TRINITY_DN1121_c0_g1~~TRINITY_DN1121_c0_g1_i1.p1  ORF type:complete len:627 (+),score=103.61 TRINITY_DN1121_c0_g1_i1:1029-2909(+)